MADRNGPTSPPPSPLAPAGTERPATFENTIELTRLPSGVRVVTERMPQAASVSVGFYVGIGSRDEDDERAGTSHFLEHLLFKGTAERSARSIAMAVDAIGGEMSAFTSREHTAYYCRLPVSQLGFGLDLLADVIERPAFRLHEVEAERDVILDELMMAEDTPDDVLHMRLMEATFPGHGIGRETLGTEASIRSLTREGIAAFHAERYRPANLVVAAAGRLEHEAVVSAVGDRFGGTDAGSRPLRLAPGTPVAPVTVTHRPIEQAHVAFAWRALDHHDDDRYALHIANQVLGGSVSSRLFQTIREERGLAYTVYSSASSFDDTGLAMMYAATSPKNLPEVVTLLDGVLDEMLADGITEQEHEVAAGFLEGSTLLSLEDTGSRMGRLGGTMTARDEAIPIEEHLERIRAVTTDDVARVLHRVFTAPRAVAAVGPFDEDEPTISDAVARSRR